MRAGRMPWRACNILAGLRKSLGLDALRGRLSTYVKLFKSSGAQELQVAPFAALQRMTHQELRAIFPSRDRRVRCTTQPMNNPKFKSGRVTASELTTQHSKV